MTDELKHIIQLIDDMRDNRVIEAAIRAHVQKAIDDEKQNPWKAAIIQELIVDNILTEELERDPRTALAAAIDWNCKVALDPSVSKEAMELQQRAIAEAQARIDALEKQRASLLKEGAEAAAIAAERIAELERELSEQADTIVDGLAKRRELERELAEARKDAERWRFAKHRFTRAASVDMSGRHTYTFIGRTIGRGLNVDEAIDAAIDAALIDLIHDLGG